jgi:hypothetical protein
MRKAIIFNGVVVMSCSMLIFLVQGRQARRELDELKNQQGVMTHEIPESRPKPKDRTAEKSLMKFHTPTSTDSFQTLNSFHTRNLVAGGGISV